MGASEMTHPAKNKQTMFFRKKKSNNMKIGDISGNGNVFINGSHSCDINIEKKILTDKKHKQLRYDIAYMKMAQEFAELSYAERAKVGCVIVSSEGQIISQGYNGMPAGMDNCCEHEEDGKLVSNKEVLHAESNAITKCAKWGGKTDGATIYITLSPCIDCAKLIIQAGIARVVYGKEYKSTEGTDLLRKVGVEVELLEI